MYVVLRCYLYIIKEQQIKTSTLKNIDLTTATESQIERAKAIIAKGAKVTFERALEIEMKADLKKGWQPMSKKDIKKYESRKNAAEAKGIHLTVDGVDYGSDISSYNAANARKMMRLR